MTLQQLKYFKEVAKTLNFTKAAENLFVAQPSLSHAIALLEKELGAPLFIRHKYKKAALTDYGEHFCLMQRIYFVSLMKAKRQ